MENKHEPFETQEGVMPSDHHTTVVESVNGGVTHPPKNTPDLLTPQQIRRIGALQVESIHDEAMEQFLSQQRASYEECRREDLIEALLDRDRQLASEGRAMATGVTGGRLLREFVRGVLTALDTRDYTRVESMLQALGAPPADARQLRLHGHTLGDGKTDAERARAFEEGFVGKPTPTQFSVKEPTK